MLLVRIVVTVWDKKRRQAIGYICSKSKFQCLHVCKHWNLDFEEIYPKARLFWQLQTKGYLDRYFALIKIFAQMWNNLCVCVCFVCAVCVFLQFRVIKYCARQKPKVILSVLRRKKTILICLQEKNLATVLDFTQKNVLFSTQTLSRVKLRTLYCDRWIKAVFLRARFIIGENSVQFALAGWFRTSVLVVFRGNLVSF